MSYTYLFTDTQIEPIIDKYINMIDDYDFRNLLISLMGGVDNLSILSSKGFSIYRDIIQRCVDVDGFEDVVYNYLSRHADDISNLNSLSIAPFTDVEVDSCNIHTASIPRELFRMVNFNCDVHISSTMIGFGCFYKSKFNGHSVYIEEGCEVLNNDIFCLADGIDIIYLPSTLTHIGYILFGICATGDVHTKINYNSTVDNFIELIKESRWLQSGSTYKLAEVINVDIICTDGVIKRGQKFDSNYNMI